VEERRRHERYSVAWPVRVWLRENTFIAGRTVDASIHGARVLLDRLPAGILELNDVCGLTICPGGPDEFNCVAVVRDLGHHYGVGLEVKDELPIPFGAPKTGGRREDEPAVGASLPRPAAGARGARILVVDDQPARRRLLGEYLVSDGYRVVQVHPDVETIFRAAQRWRPDLILLDMGLTDADALEMLRRVRREAPAIGVIILTGNRELALARLGFELGATDCLFKPFDLSRLGQAVRSSLALTPRDGG
jgi:CheY-like chemotaxis protein